MADLRVALTLTGKDDGASAAVKAVAQSTRELNEASTASNKAALEAAAAYRARNAAATEATLAQRAATAAASAATTATTAATTATHGFSLATAGAQRELGVLASELARGNIASFEKSLITLTRQTGLLNLAFSASGIAIGLVGGALIAVGVQAYEAIKRQDDYSKALITTGNAAGETVADLVAMQERITATSHDFADSSAAVLKLAQSGRITGDALEAAAGGAVAFAQITGESIDKASEEFAKLSEEPAKASAKLNEQYHYLTAAIYEQIVALEKAGDAEAASALAVNAAAQALKERSAQIQDEAGYIAKAWRFAADEVAAFKQQLDSLGSTSGQAQLASAMLEKQRLDVIATNKELADQGDLWAGLKVRLSGTVQGYESARSANDALIESLTKTGTKEKQLASDQAENARVQKEGIDGQNYYDKLSESVDKTTKKTNELKKAAQSLYAIYQANPGDARLKGVNFDGPVADQPQGAAWDKLKKQIEGAGNAAKVANKDLADAARTINDLNNDVKKGDQIAIAAIATTDGGTKAFGAYLLNINAVAEAEKALPALRAQGKISAEEEARQMALLSAGGAALTAQYALLATKKQAIADIDGYLGSASDQLDQKWADEIAAIGGDNDARALLVATMQAEREARAALKRDIENAGTAEEAEAIKATTATRLADADAFAVHMVAAKKDAEVGKEWAKVWTSAGDSIASGFGKVASDAIFHFKSIGDTFKSVGNVLKDTAAQVVQQLISTFLRLSVINPILQSLGLGGGGLLMSGGGGGGSGIGQSASGLLLGGFTGQGASVAGGSGTGVLGSANNLLQVGQTIYKGFGTAAQLAGNGYSSLTGAYTYTNAIEGFGPSAELAGNFTGPPSSLAGGGSAAYGGYGSGVGQAVGIAGGVYAGYNRFNQSNHDAGGALGGVAYGVGTYYAGAAIATGVGVGAGAAVAGGVGAGAAAGLAVIPVIGWIALAAILVDKLSGGKLFGTKGVPTGGWAEIGTTANGGTAQNFIDMKGQSAFFGGARFSQKQEKGSPEQIAAAQAFFDAMKKGSDDFAKQFGSTAGEVAAGSFSQKFDKKGKLTGETISHINGETYKNETQEQFASRIQAESFTQDLKAVSVDITAYTHEFIKNADDYSAAVQASASVAQSANADIKAGVTFLATGADQSIQAIFNLAASMVKGSETIADAFKAIEQAQIQYTQFVGQFKAAPTYASAFQAALAGIAATYAANVKQANALAIAAGAAGAANKDLANIQASAAAQLANAIKQLQASSQGLANDLGYTTQGESVDQLNAQINAITQSAQQAAPAINGASNALANAAASATRSIGLLLGSLSPLNDQQKLQTALAGQRAGTVTPEQVLEIGRRLFASSAAYTALFRQVTAVGDRTGNGESQGGSGGSTASGPTLTAAQQAAIKALSEQRDAALKEQRRQEALQLAHNIADLAQSTGESFDDVAKGLGFKIEDVMKDLGITDRAEFDKQLAAYEKLQTSAGDNNASLIDAITTMQRAIVDAITGHSGDHGTPTDAAPDGRPAQGTDLTGHAGAHIIAGAIVKGLSQVNRPGGRGPNFINR